MLAFWLHWIWLLAILQTVTCLPISDTLPSGNFSRSRRAPKGDNLPPLVSNFQALARLINGVSMEAGLLTGLIPSEDLVSELLHMGSLKPKDIINLDSKILNDALTGLAELPTTLKSSTEIGNLEARLVLLEDVRINSSFVHDFINYTGRADYTTHLEDAQKLDGFKNEVQGMKNEMNALNSALQKTVSNTEAKVDDISVDFPYIHKNLLKTETAIQGFDEVAALVHKILLTRDSSKFIDLFYLENENRIKLKDSQFVDKKARAEFVDNIKQVYTSRTNALKAQKDFKTIQQLITESYKMQKAFLYTSGFINQFEDLDVLDKDSENGWIAGHVNQSKLVSESLKKAFGALDPLKIALKSVQTKWIPLNKSENQKSFEDVQTAQLNMAQVPDNSEAVYNAVSAFSECDANVDYPGKVFQTVDPVKAKIEELAGLMRQINNMDYFESLKDLSILKVLFDVNGKTDEQKKELGLNLIKIMKSESPEKKMIQNLKLLETNLDVLISVSPQINKLAKEMDLTVPDDLHKDLAQKSYLNIYTCLEKIGESGKAVKDMVQMIQKFRTNKKGSEDMIVKAVLESVDYLKEVKKSAEKMKKVRAPEALALNSSFPNSQKFSNMIGMAGRGLTSILEIHQKRDILKPFLENMDDIKNDAKAKNLTPEQEATIEKLAKIKEEMMKTLAAIDLFRKSLNVGKMRRKRRRAYRRPRNAKIPNFESLQTVLKDAAKIPGVIFVSEKELEEIKKTMNALNTANSKNAVTALESLENLNLDFSSFGFQGAIASLAAIDRFFESYSKAMSKASSSGPQSIPGGTNQSMPQLSPVSSVQWFEDPAVMAPAGAIACGLAIFFILLWLGYCRCLFGKKVDKHNELDEEDTQHDEDAYFCVGKTVYNAIMAQNSEKKTPHYWGKKLLDHLNGAGELNITNADKQANIAERRYPNLICTKATAVSLNGFDDPFINANVMKFKKGSVIMSQAPLDGNEMIRNENGVLVYYTPKKKSTIEKHWAMIDQYTVQGLVMTCDFVEKQIKKCPEYFPLVEGGELEFGRYKIKTIRVEKELKQFTDKKNFTLYTIEYKNSLKPEQPPKSLKLLQYTGWPDHGSPIEPEPALEIVSFMNQFEDGNVLVHCHAGIGRTGTLVALKNGMEMVKTSKNLDIISVLSPVRNCRYGSIQSSDQFTYLALCMTKAAMKYRNVPYLKEFDALQYFHEKESTGKYESVKDYENDAAFMEKFCAEDKAEMEAYCKRKREEYEAAEKKRKEKEKEMGPTTKNAKKSKEKSKEANKKKSKENPKKDQKKDQKKPKPAVKK